MCIIFFFFFSSRRRHTRYWRDWSSDVCSSDLGKTNTPEFGAGSQTFNPVFGPTRNPYDPTKTCGGRSPGAARALRSGKRRVGEERRSRGGADTLKKKKKKKRVDYHGKHSSS